MSKERPPEMSYSAKVIADSLSPNGVRLTTLEVTMPRIVLAEFNTHRMLSRNSASSRAIPVEKRIAMVKADPFIPTAFGKNQKGMRADAELTGNEEDQALLVWKIAMTNAVQSAQQLATLGVHKQLANRLIEPFCWQTIVVTATDWDNYFALRCSPEAQPEIRIASEMILEAIIMSAPTLLRDGEWHLPYVALQDSSELRAGVLTGKSLAKVSAARCARVSVLTQDGKRDLNEDLALYERLVKNGHMSPLEHPATPVLHEHAKYFGNFRGWLQLRKTIPFESDFSKRST